MRLRTICLALVTSTYESVYLFVCCLGPSEALIKEVAKAIVWGSKRRWVVDVDVSNLFVCCPCQKRVDCGSGGWEWGEGG
jgi:hypothetical protein